MSKHRRPFSPLPAALLAISTTTVAFAATDEPPRGAREVIPLDVTELYFELNDTDGDLGFHGLLDGEPWRNLDIWSSQKRLMQVRMRGALRRQGGTELFFESAEPTFDELDPKRFFHRFPEGTYAAVGLSLEGDLLVGETEVTHLIPEPVPNLAVNGELVPEDCDEGPVPEVAEPLSITWDPAMFSHPELGRTNEMIDVVRYEAVLEQEEPEEIKITILLPPDVTEVEVPEGLFEPGEEVKVEVLVREESGNQTATESCFEIEE